MSKTTWFYVQEGYIVEFEKILNIVVLILTVIHLSIEIKKELR
ncbi:MAG: hypothetical protein PUI05_03630 [Peptoniphilaceae bacterium]|nr:hypothetical protein [Peptoniphilaceae bacterium]